MARLVACNSDPPKSFPPGSHRSLNPLQLFDLRLLDARRVGDFKFETARVVSYKLHLEGWKKKTIHRGLFHSIYN